MAWGSKSGEAAPRAGGSMSFIGSEVSITGNISASGDIHLDGAVQGDVSCGSLTIGASGHVKGNVLAQRATVAGAVEGSAPAQPTSPAKPTLSSDPLPDEPELVLPSHQPRV